MGTLALAAKITHVPSMYLSEQPGPHHGCRQAAIDGHREIGRRCRESGVDTIVVLDTHWLVNSEYHINCAPEFEGLYTSSELPHFIKNMPFRYPGNPELGGLCAEMAQRMGIRTRSHPKAALPLDYGTLVPMRYMNSDGHFKVVSVAAWCAWHDLRESEHLGLALRTAIEERYDGTVAVLASGSLSHRFAENGRADEFLFKVYDPFLERTDRSVLDLWVRGDFPAFLDMLPMYANKCWGEGGMHDTAMLLGLLGGKRYRTPAEIVTPYFGSSGTGQVNAVFPVTPLHG